MHIYLDDILDVFCVKRGVTIKASKCERGTPMVTVLLLVILSSGITPLLDKVTAIQDYSERRSYQTLGNFVGLVKFY